MAVVTVKKIYHPSFDGPRWLVGCATCAALGEPWSTVCSSAEDVLPVVYFHRCPPELATARCTEFRSA